MTIALVVIFLILQVADVGSTRAVLSRGGRELNPVGRLFLRYGTAGLVGMKVIVSAIFLYCVAEMGGRLQTAFLAGACAVYAVVVVHNLRVLRRQRGRDNHIGKSS